MVVGGYSKLRELKNPVTSMCAKDKFGECIIKAGLINDVEVIKSSKSAKEENLCTKFVSPMFGYTYVLGKDKDGLIVENMNDTPYVKSKMLGPEIVAAMTATSSAVRAIFPQEKPVGIQILAGANKRGGPGEERER